ncbi:MAG: chemotaxis protein CheC, partial [Candidatus Polarisedimenticolia bacterium]
PTGGFRAVSEAGARDAATALSQIIGRPLRLQVPWARLIPLPRVAALAGGAERVVCALSLKVYGEIRGNLLLVLERGQVALLLDLLLKDRRARDASPAPDGELTALEESALLEVGNIVAGAYLNSISRLLGVSLLPSIPGLALDMAGAVTDFLLIELAPLSEEALVLASEVREPQSGLRCGIFFLPDPSARAALEAAPARGPAEDPAA